MNEIDKCQESLDALNDQIAETEIEFSHVRAEITLLHKIKAKHAISSTFCLASPTFELSILDPEHRDFINDYMDRIYEVEMKVGHQETKNHQLPDEADITHKRLKEELSAIHSNAQTLKHEELAISGLIERHEDLDQLSGGNVELEKLLISLEDQIACEGSEIDSRNRGLDILEEMTESDLGKMTAAIASTSKLANWDDETPREKDEIASVSISPRGEIEGILCDRSGTRNLFRS
jgi:uncharacterized coiled-coil protein SlyX